MLTTHLLSLGTVDESICRRVGFRVGGGLSNLRGKSCCGLAKQWPCVQRFCEAFAMITKRTDVQCLLAFFGIASGIQWIRFRSL